MRIVGVAVLLGTLTAPVAAQWLSHPTPGIPRTADGRPNLTAPGPHRPDGTPDLSGLWNKNASAAHSIRITRDLKPEEVQPWARALVEERRQDLGKGHMTAQCLPLGPAAVTDSGQGTEWMRIVQTPALVLFLYADLSYRQIFMDGRALETEPNPAWMGYSVGRWEGDTLVVETNGFNARTWLDRDGHPHTEALRTTERYRRRDFGHLEIEMTLRDPAVYARPWTVSFTAEFAPDTEMLEFVCNENPNRLEHWVGRLSDDKTAAVAVAPAVLARYVGTYVEQPPTFLDRSPGRVIQVALRDGQLYGVYDGAAETPLYAQSETRFSGLTYPIEFIVDGTAATGLRVQHVRNTYAFTRAQ